jgi:hypothetical protein
MLVSLAAFLFPLLRRTAPAERLAELVEILVANRLLDPRPLYRLGSWASKATLADSYPLSEQPFHYDRLGRALERLAERPAVQAALVRHALRATGKNDENA